MMYRGCKIKLTHLTGSQSLYSGIFGSDAITRWQRAFVQFEDEVTTTVFIGDCRTGQMESTVFIGGN